MRRPYTIEYYASLVDDIRARIPNASIGSDIIVGFPGETDDDFEQLAALPRALAADAHPCLPVFRSSGHGGVGDAAARCTASVVRERGRRDSRHRSAAEPSGSASSQVGTTHRALTLEDGTRCRDRELPEGADSAGPGAQRVGARQADVTGRRRAAGRLTSSGLPRSADRRRRGCRARGSCAPTP